MANIYDMADTWNNAGTTFTAIKMNVTDTASAAASLLMDLQVGGVSKFSVNKSGGIRSASGYSTTNVLLGPADNTGFAWSGTSLFHITSGTANFSIYTNGIKVNGDKSIGFSTAGVDAGDPDLYLYRDAANILAQRNGTNAQAFRLYNTHTDVSNYERTAIYYDVSGNFKIEGQKAGTGASRDMQIVSNNEMYFSTLSTFRWHINTSGHLRAYADNTYDIGASSGKPRYIYAGSAFVHPATTVASLPAAGTAGQGATAFVTDATATTARSTVAGGGANKVLVMSDGTNWLIVA